MLIPGPHQWIVEPPTLDATRQELRLVIDELALKRLQLRELQSEVYELEYDRKHLATRLIALQEEAR